MRFWSLLVPFWCLFSPLLAVQFTEHFDEVRSNLWQISVGNSAQVKAREGCLIVDMSASKAGKWAFLVLKRAFSVPFSVTWRQRLTHDSPFA